MQNKETNINLHQNLKSTRKQMEQKFPSQGEIVALGQEVLNKESHAIKLASTQLDGRFAEAIKKILTCRGQVVISALGKSGHVGSKISATLASTGTPAYFLHASEALHGDFGRIMSSDIMLAIAFVGEPREVLSVCKFAKRKGLTVIAITGNLKSSLAKIADIVLDASIPFEADTLGLAPTSSSSVSMSIGDALAVTLMEIRGFSAENFASLHPGGSLGRSFLKVSEVMHPQSMATKIDEYSDFHSILEAVTSPNFGIVPVQSQEGIVLGSISDGDLRRALLKFGGKALNLLAKDLMSASPKVVNLNMEASEVISVLEKYKITSVFVIDSENRYKGLVRMHDLLTARVI